MHIEIEYAVFWTNNFRQCECSFYSTEVCEACSMVFVGEFFVLQMLHFWLKQAKHRCYDPFLIFLP